MEGEVYKRKIGFLIKLWGYDLEATATGCPKRLFEISSTVKDRIKMNRLHGKIALFERPQLLLATKIVQSAANSLRFQTLHDAI